MSEPTGKCTDAKSGTDKSLCLTFIRFISRAYFKDSLKLSNQETVNEIHVFIERLDTLFLAKCAIYMRSQYNIKGVSNFIAVELFDRISGNKWAKDFYDKIVLKPDDMVEIAELFIRNGSKLPNCVKKGFHKAFNRFDSLQMLKMSTSVNGFGMKDLINLVHPKSNKKNKTGISILLNQAVEIKNENIEENELLDRINEIRLA